MGKSLLMFLILFFIGIATVIVSQTVGDFGYYLESDFLISLSYTITFTYGIFFIKMINEISKSEHENGNIQ